MEKAHCADEYQNSRRDFIKKSLLGAGTFFVSLSPLKLFSQNPEVSNQQLSLKEAEHLAKNAKELFYKKQYEEASEIYKSIIVAFPGHIQFYDNYSKVLKCRHMLLESAELYKEGMNKNPGNPYFIHRLALNIRAICTGDNKSANEFASKYGVNDLYDYSAQMLLSAVRLKPEDKSLSFDLVDFVHIETKNRQAGEAYFSVNLPETTLTEIGKAAGSLETEWSQLRSSRKPVINDNIETRIGIIKNRKRRYFYFEDEIKQNNEAVKKSKKTYLLNAFNQAIEEKKIIKTDFYGMMILADDIEDTYTIGKLRMVYKRNKDYIRLISLNRYLYTHNKTVPNALALSSVLSTHGSVLNLYEANEILNTVKPEHLFSMYAVSYYISMANIYTRTNKNSRARETLLTGIERFDGKGGMAYSMLEKYAVSFQKEKYKVSVNLLKALSGKNTEVINDPVWELITKYRMHAAKSPLSIEEQLKPLRALAKIQQLKDKAGYQATLSEIKALENQKEELI